MGSLFFSGGEVMPAVAEIITADDFADDWLRRVYVVSAELLERSIPIDAVVVHNAAPDLDLAALLELDRAVASSNNVAHHARIVRDFALLDRVQKLCERFGAAAQKAAPSDAAGLAQAFQEAVMTTFSDGRGSALMPTLDVLKETQRDSGERFNARREGRRVSDAVSLGIDDLDHMLDGGYTPGDLVVQAGRPSMGKTMVALAKYRRVAQKSAGMAHLFVSLESRPLAIGRRLLSAESTVPLKTIRAGDADDMAAGKMLEGLKRLRADLANTWIYDKPAASVQDVRTAVRTMKARTGLPVGLVVVDHLHLMRSSGRAMSRNDEVSQITAGLKAIARAEGCVVLLLAQLNRKCEERPNKRPVLSDLRDSGAIEQDADLVEFVYRDEVYNPETPDKGTAELIIAKQRDGEIGTVRLYCNTTTQQIGGLRRDFHGNAALALEGED